MSAILVARVAAPACGSAAAPPLTCLGPPPERQSCHLVSRLAGWRAARVVVCISWGRAARAVRVTRHGTRVAVDWVDIRPPLSATDACDGASQPAGGGAAAPATAMPPGTRRTSVVAILPKSRYLMRTLDVPQVSPEEVQRMLELETCAFLPPEFGEAEIAYRRLPKAKAGHERYEVYVARREDLWSHLSQLSACGLQPDVLLPSAVAWSAVYNAGPRADLLVARVGPEEFETCTAGADGAVALRSIPAAEFRLGLVECVRPLLGRAGGGRGDRVSLAWLGEDCRPGLGDERVTETSFDGTAAVVPSELAFLRHVGPMIVDFPSSPDRRTADLLPQGLVHRRVGHGVRSAALGAAAALLAAAVLAYVAVAVTAARYRSATAAGASRIASIRKEGEAIGGRIQQLAAVRTSRASRDDFARVMGAIHDVTPEGVTYNGVELGDGRAVRLQGQAQSLALPIILPERLEQHAALRDVQLRDAAQSKRGEGSVADFRIECRLEAEVEQ
jgi:hypothetical protein